MSDDATNEIHQLLMPLTEQLSYRADDLLDFRECALSRTSAGRCVRCYFRLYQGASVESSLLPLRSWLEKNIEVVACDEKKRMLEKMPLLLEEQELETLCWRFIHEFRDNRAYNIPHINLEFRYKQLQAA